MPAIPVPIANYYVRRWDNFTIPTQTPTISKTSEDSKTPLTVLPLPTPSKSGIQESTSTSEPTQPSLPSVVVPPSATSSVLLSSKESSSVNIPGSLGSPSKTSAFEPSKESSSTVVTPIVTPSSSSAFATSTSTSTPALTNRLSETPLPARTTAEGTSNSPSSEVVVNSSRPDAAPTLHPNSATATTFSTITRSSKELPSDIDTDTDTIPSRTSDTIIRPNSSFVSFVSSIIPITEAPKPKPTPPPASTAQSSSGSAESLSTESSVFISSSKRSLGLGVELPTPSLPLSLNTPPILGNEKPKPTVTDRSNTDGVANPNSSMAVDGGLEISTEKTSSVLNTFTNSLSKSEFESKTPSKTRDFSPAESSKEEKPVVGVTGKIGVEIPSIPSPTPTASPIATPTQTEKPLLGGLLGGLPVVTNLKPVVDGVVKPATSIIGDVARPVTSILGSILPIHPPASSKISSTSSSRPSATESSVSSSVSATEESSALPTPSKNPILPIPPLITNLAGISAILPPATSILDEVTAPVTAIIPIPDVSVSIGIPPGISGRPLEPVEVGPSAAPVAPSNSAEPTVAPTVQPRPTAGKPSLSVSASVSASVAPTAAPSASVPPFPNVPIVSDPPAVSLSLGLPDVSIDLPSGKPDPRPTAPASETQVTSEKVRPSVPTETSKEVTVSKETSLTLSLVPSLAKPVEGTGNVTVSETSNETSKAVETPKDTPKPTQTSTTDGSKESSQTDVPSETPKPTGTGDMTKAPSSTTKQEESDAASTTQKPIESPSITPAPATSTYPPKVTAKPMKPIPDPSSSSIAEEKPSIAPTALPTEKPSPTEKVVGSLTPKPTDELSLVPFPSPSMLPSVSPNPTRSSFGLLLPTVPTKLANAAADTPDTPDGLPLPDKAPLPPSSSAYVITTTELTTSMSKSIAAITQNDGKVSTSTTEVPVVKTTSKVVTNWVWTTPSSTVPGGPRGTTVITVVGKDDGGDANKTLAVVGISSGVLVLAALVMAWVIWRKWNSKQQKALAMDEKRMMMPQTPWPWSPGPTKTQEGNGSYVSGQEDVITVVQPPNGAGQADGVNETDLVASPPNTPIKLISRWKQEHLIPPITPGSPFELRTLTATLNPQFSSQSSRFSSEYSPQSSASEQAASENNEELLTIPCMDFRPESWNSRMSQTSTTLEQAIRQNVQRVRAVPVVTHNPARKNSSTASVKSVGASMTAGSPIATTSPVKVAVALHQRGSSSSLRSNQYRTPTSQRSQSSLSSEILNPFATPLSQRSQSSLQNPFGTPSVTPQGSTEFLRPGSSNSLSHAGSNASSRSDVTDCFSDAYAEPWDHETNHRVSVVDRTTSLRKSNTVNTQSSTATFQTARAGEYALTRPATSTSSHQWKEERDIQGSQGNGQRDSRGSQASQSSQGRGGRDSQGSRASGASTGTYTTLNRAQSWFPAVFDWWGRNEDHFLSQNQEQDLEVQAKDMGMSESPTLGNPSSSATSFSTLVWRYGEEEERTSPTLAVFKVPQVEGRDSVEATRWN